MLPLGQIIRHFNISFHFYADDTQIYLSIDPLDTSSTTLTPLIDCLTAIHSWMSNNFLLLNNKKTEIIVFGSKIHWANVSLLLEAHGLHCSSEARNLGVVLDSNLNFNKHFSNITKSAIFQLRSISKIRSFIYFSDAQTIIHAFVTNHLDYCNSLFAGLPQKSTNRLQLVQNTAARVLTRTRKYDHISPILATLHWLPVAFRIDFKILLFVFKSRNDLAPSYISDLLSPYTPSRNLISSDQLLTWWNKCKPCYGRGQSIFYKAATFVE